MAFLTNNTEYEALIQIIYLNLQFMFAFGQYHIIMECIKYGEIKSHDK